MNEASETTHLDPAATLQELVMLADVKERAAAGAARMVEDHLRSRVLVLATHNTQLMAANEALTAKLATGDKSDD